MTPSYDCFQWINLRQEDQRLSLQATLIQIIPKFPYPKAKKSLSAIASMINCSTDLIENGKIYDDIDKLLAAGATCLLKSVGKELQTSTIQGTLNGYMTDAYFAKYRAEAEFDLEDRNTVAVSYKPISDSNDIIIHFNNHLNNETLNGKITYTRGNVDGLMTSHTTTRNHLTSATLRVNCRADYDTENSQTDTSTNQNTTETTDSREVGVVVSPGNRQKMVIRLRSKLETMRVVQPVVLSGYIGAVTKNGEKYFLPLTELSKYFPDHFRPDKDNKIRLLVMDFQTVSSFYFLSKAYRN